MSKYKICCCFPTTEKQIPNDRNTEQETSKNKFVAPTSTAYQRTINQQNQRQLVAVNVRNANHFSISSFALLSTRLLMSAVVFMLFSTTNAAYVSTADSNNASFFSNRTSSYKNTADADFVGGILLGLVLVAVVGVIIFCCRECYKAAKRYKTKHAMRRVHFYDPQQPIMLLDR